MSKTPTKPVEKDGSKPEEGVTRRNFITGISAAAVSAFLARCTPAAREEFFQQHFQELQGAELEKVLARMEAEYEVTYGKPFEVGAEPALEETLFGYALDLSRCVGCRKCVYACVDENNQSRDPQVHWITVLEMAKETGVNVMESDAYYEAEEVPRKGHFYMPVQCQQCRKPACVKSCPAAATWSEPDGIVVVDYNWCIGCRCCMAACPYGARHFNWADPVIPDDKVNPNTHYLGNRPRPRGVVEKCTFCVQRTRNGLYPSCVEICPVGARKFGNLLDPASEIRYVIENKRIFILKEELNTQPKFFYFYGV